MTLKDVLDKYKALNTSNPYDDARLADMVQTLDRTIQVEMKHTFPYITTLDADTGDVIKTDGVMIDYSYPTDQDTVVQLSGTPFDDIYVIYMMSITYFEEADWMRYSNQKGMFNARYVDANNYFSRNYMQVQANSFRNYW